MVSIKIHAYFFYNKCLYMDLFSRILCKGTKMVPDPLRIVVLDISNPTQLFYKRVIF